MLHPPRLELLQLEAYLTQVFFGILSDHVNVPTFIHRICFSIIERLQSVFPVYSVSIDLLKCASQPFAVQRSSLFAAATAIIRVLNGKKAKEATASESLFLESMLVDELQRKEEVSHATAAGRDEPQTPSPATPEPQEVPAEGSDESKPIEVESDVPLVIAEGDEEEGDERRHENVEADRAIEEAVVTPTASTECTSSPAEALPTGDPNNLCEEVPSATLPTTDAEPPEETSHRKRQRSPGDHDEDGRGAPSHGDESEAEICGDVDNGPNVSGPPAVGDASLGDHVTPEGDTEPLSNSS